MKKAIYNILTWGLIGFSIACFIFPTLPDEITTRFPELSPYMVFLVGGTSGLLGGGALTVTEFLRKSKTDNQTQFSQLATNYLNLEKKYDILAKNQEISNNLKSEENKLLKRNNELLEASLKVKLDNKFITKESRKLIKDAIGGDSDEADIKE